jgi:2-hydroxy-3-keto-5-methylthiopentenyl-1-phosphate phosphatase
MGSIALPYMATKPQLIFFTDFDGTITVDDSEYILSIQIAQIESEANSPQRQ